jgi:hypothetical protein
MGHADGAMPRRLSARAVARWGVYVLVASCVPASACRGASEPRLEGRWLGQRFESLDGSVSAGRAGWALGASLTFSSSMVSVQVPGEAARQGRYEVLSDEDGELQLSIIGHDGHVDHAELTLETDELLRWHVTSVHTLIMRHD